jgi:hypothetical protein
MVDTDRADPSDAFDYLNEYFYLSSGESSPDGAIDYIFMMHEKDWELLENAWKESPPKWRENCAYILGCGSITECMPMLLESALFDENIDVAEQAVASITGLLIEFDDEYDLPVRLDDEMVARMRYILGMMDKKIYAKENEVLDNLHWTSDCKWEFNPRNSESKLQEIE